MKLTATLVMVLACCFLNAQNYCGFDQFQSHLKTQNPHWVELELNMNDAIVERIYQMRAAGGFEDLIIPVVVHVVHNNGAENITDEQVILAIDHLNQAFANSGEFMNDEGLPTGIQFCLAQRDPDNNFTNGINHVESAELTDLLVPSEDQLLKDLIRWETSEYLNIWVVQEITREVGNAGVVGYATLPPSHGTENDGIVCEAGTFGASVTGSKVHIHECGHYLGLYHTFENGCPNDNCLFAGDKVCDTPPDAHVFNMICNDGTNSCVTDEDDTSDNNPFRPVGLGGLGDQLDDQTNYMDYSNLSCFNHFSPGQAERMLAALLETRESLLDGLQCLPPCGVPITVDYNTSNTNILINESVFFANNSSDFTESGWYIDGEFITSDLTFEQVFDSAGTFVVELVLENEDPGCVETITIIVEVSCPAIASFEASSSSVQPGEEVSFNNTSEQATGYEWYINGVLVATSVDLIYIFEEVGGQSIQLIALAEGCQDSSEIWFVEVGTCDNGNEANIWNFMLDNANLYGLNFNNAPPSGIPSDPYDVPTGHCKTTICDDAGNLLFSCTGTNFLNKNYEVTPNGSDLGGHLSSHFGTLIIQKPGSDSEYYVFTTDAQENNYANGLRYSIADVTLDNGLGDLTEEKNILIDVTHSEAIVAVRHCNLTDFWLVSYDGQNSMYKSFLVTNNGITGPITATIPNDNAFEGLAIKPSPSGDRLILGLQVLAFDNSNGMIELEHTLDMEFALGAEFSPSGQFLYFLSGDLFTELYQFDTNLNPQDWVTNAVIYESPNDPIYFYPQLASNGKIYLEEILTNQVSIIHQPNLPGMLADVEEFAFGTGALVNSFGSYYQGYVLGRQVYIDGPIEVCAGGPQEYTLDNFECLTDDISWTVDGVSVAEQSYGVVEIDFPNPGTYFIEVTVSTDCGDWIGQLTVDASSGPPLELGQDQYLCEGQSLILDAGDVWTSYQWQDGSTNQTFTVDAPGEYEVIVSDGICTISDAITILGSVAPVIDLGPDFDMCEGDVVVLDIGPGYTDPMWQDGTTGPTYTVFDGGTYTVTVTEPCETSDSVFVDDCDQDITGIDADAVDRELTVFPNPVSDFLNVEFKSPVQLENMYLTNAAGQIVMEKLHTESTSGTTWVLDLRNVSTGRYHLHLMLEGRNIVKEVVIRKR